MFSRIKKTLFLFLFAAASCVCSAQLFSPFKFRFKTYTTNDGLAHNFVKKCINDSKGFLWIITENGLSRFDGFQFKNYQHIYNDSSSLPANDLWDIAIDGTDRVYVAYRSGLCVMDTAGHFTPIKKEHEQIPADKIVFDPKRNQLLIGTKEGMLLFDAASKKIKTTSLQEKMPGFITAMYIDKQDNAWLMIERNGYYRYNIAADTFFHYNSTDWPMGMYQDNNGIYYLSTWQSGFQVFNSIQEEHNKKVYQFKLTDMQGYNFIFCNAAEAPALTGTDILWVPTHSSGVGLFSKSQQKFIHHFTYTPQLKNGLGSSFFWSAYYDPYGNLWACSWHGLTKISAADKHFISSELPELYTNNYNCVTGIMDDPHDGNTAWMSIVGSGISKYDKRLSKMTNRYFQSETEPDRYYKEEWAVYMFKDSNQIIWSPSYAGVIKIKNQQVSFKEISDSGRYAYSASHYQDSRGHIWLAGQLLIEFDPYTEKSNRWKFNDPGQKNNYFHGLCENLDGLLYAATGNGIYYINTQSKRTGKLYFPATFSDSAKWSTVLSVTAINNVLYLGSENGLAAFDLRTNSVRILGASHNLIKIGANSFYVDKQRLLWVLCSNGLFRYDPTTGAIQQFTTSDGIYATSNDPCFFFPYNNDLYIGARMAYTRFDPSLIHYNPNIPKPFITTITVNNIPTNITGSSEIPESFSNIQNNISFDFTAIEYNFPEKLVFRYMLEGYDKDWSKAGLSRRKSYTNLPPGQYVFKLIAINNNGIASSRAASVSFTIRPPFWQTIWFRVLAMAIVITGIFSIYKWRIKKLQAAQNEKNKLQQVQLDQYKQQLEMEQIVNFFSTSLADKNTQEEVIWDVAKNLIQKSGFANCMIYLWNEDKTELLQKAGYGPNGSLETVVKDPFNAKLWEGIVGHVAATKKPIMLGDTSKDPRYRADVLNRSSELCVPALYNGELISVIDSEDFAKDYYTQTHLQVLTTIATLMAARLVSIEAAEETRRKKEELAKMNEQLAQLELAALRSQMNPHFIFNSLNSIHKYIWENKQQDASEYLTKFSRLIRMILENSKEKEIALSEEIDMLHLYIELEHRRCNGRFNYSVEVDKNIDAANTAIASMLIQPYVENAIWHGLVQKEGPGNLRVYFAENNHMLECTIEDDGIGREKAMEIKRSKQDNHTSLGLSITGKRVSLLYNETGETAKVQVFDKKDKNGKACGTKVIMQLPLNNLY
jgi:ligand-binding sensor domain-containing protein/putative methionine-R-sulfoxide reductase with GAF domain/anti-sigma regulatory factor (Ser/Thr protein kinase)